MVLLVGPLNNMGLEMLSTMFGGLAAGSLAVPNRSNEPPEQLYATQLSQLQEMRFFDTQENIRALIATSGNIHAAVQLEGHLEELGSTLHILLLRRSLLQPNTMMMNSMFGSLKLEVLSLSPGITLVRFLAGVLRSLSTSRKISLSTLRSAA
ncbi:hypothetical protein JHK82_027698 [Glycine max]|nr:hypothetical protein JHK82_027698 [Glycine max]KAH1137722.1 hypothetical protein GYH30_027631 [Glycine max]